MKRDQPQKALKQKQVTEKKPTPAARSDQAFEQAGPRVHPSYIWAHDRGTPYFWKIAEQLINKHAQLFRGTIRWKDSGQIPDFPNRNLSLFEFEITNDGGFYQRHLLLGISGKIGTKDPEYKLFQEKTIPQFLQEVKLPDEVDNLHVLLDYNPGTDPLFDMEDKTCSEPKIMAELGRFVLLLKQHYPDCRIRVRG